MKPTPGLRAVRLNGVAQEWSIVTNATGGRVGDAISEKWALQFAAAPRLVAACVRAERLIRDGGTVPVRGETWAELVTALNDAGVTV